MLRPGRRGGRRGRRGRRRRRRPRPRRRRWRARGRVQRARRRPPGRATPAAASAARTSAAQPVAVVHARDDDVRRSRARPRRGRDGARRGDLGGRAPGLRRAAVRAPGRHPVRAPARIPGAGGGRASRRRRERPARRSPSRGGPARGDFRGAATSSGDGTQRRAARPIFSTGLGVHVAYCATPFPNDQFIDTSTCATRTSRGVEPRVLREELRDARVERLLHLGRSPGVAGRSRCTRRRRSASTPRYERLVSRHRQVECSAPSGRGRPPELLTDGHGAVDARRSRRGTRTRLPERSIEPRGIGRPPGDEASGGGAAVRTALERRRPERAAVPAERFVAAELHRPRNGDPGGCTPQARRARRLSLGAGRVARRPAPARASSRGARRRATRMPSDEEARASWRERALQMERRESACGEEAELALALRSSRRIASAGTRA